MQDAKREAVHFYLSFFTSEAMVRSGTSYRDHRRRWREAEAAAHARLVRAGLGAVLRQLAAAPGVRSGPSEGLRVDEVVGFDPSQRQSWAATCAQFCGNSELVSYVRHELLRATCELDTFGVHQACARRRAMHSAVA